MESQMKLVMEQMNSMAVQLTQLSKEINCTLSIMCHTQEWSKPCMFIHDDHYGEDEQHEHIRILRKHDNLAQPEEGER